jgi:membrane-associated phospholipid phosphatase
MVGGDGGGMLPAMTSLPGPAAAGPRTRLLTGGAAGIAAMAVLGAVARDRWTPLDTWVVRDARIPTGSPLAAAVEVVAGTAVLIAAAGLLFATAAAVLRPSVRGGLWRAAVLLAACVALAATQVLFRRPGPPGAGQAWTYPSGHATVVIAVAVTTVVLCRWAVPAWTRPVVAAEAAAVVATTASRVLLGEHFPTDVLGAVIGVAGVGLVVTALVGPPVRERPADPV